MNKFFKITAAALLTVLFLAGFAYSWDGKDPQQHRRDRDIKIMSNIISTILMEKNSHFTSSMKVKGVYLDGYGYVFTAPVKGVFSYSYTTVLEDGGEKEKDEEKITTEILKNRLLDFYVDYVSTLRTAKPDDWLTIYVDCGESNRFFVTARTLNKRLTDKGVVISSGEDEEGNRVESFIISARVKDINEANRGSLSRAAFEKRAKFSIVSEKNQDKDFLRDIRVLKSIIKATFEDYTKTYRNYDLFYSSDFSGITGTYLDGYGVLLTMDDSRLGINNVLKEYVEEEKNKAMKEKEEKAKESERKSGRTRRNYDRLLGLYTDALDKEALKEKFEKYGKELVNLLSEVFADYGHTLRKLKQNDNIAILISSRSYWGASSFSMVVTMKKGDIEDYKDGKLNLQTFKDKVKYQIF